MNFPFERNQGPMTRSQLLRRAAVGGAALSLPGLLAACGGGGGIEGQGATTAATTEVSQELADKLVFANWPFYIDVDEETQERPSLVQFTQETGVEVEYLEADLYPFFDLIVITNGPQVDRLIGNGWLTPLDQSALSNFRAHASDLVRDPSWDPGNRYSVAWQSGLTGIAYRAEAVEALGREPDSIHDLFDAKLEGRVGMMMDALDLGSAGLLAIGVEPGTSTEDDWRRAAEELRRQRSLGLVRRYYGQSYLGALRRGDIWISQAWSGDIFQVQQLGHDLSFVVPQEGAMLWTDNMLIPANARHPRDAMTYIDFVYRPDVAAMIADWVWYISPVPEARRIIARRYGHEDVAKSPLVFPTEGSLGPTGSMKRYPVFETEEAAEAWRSIFASIAFGL